MSVNIHFRLFLSPHSVSERVNVSFLKFISNFVQKPERLLKKKKVMYMDCSTFKCEYNVLCFIRFD